eukprot:UN32642
MEGHICVTAGKTNNHGIYGFWDCKKGKDFITMTNRLPEESKGVRISSKNDMFWVHDKRRIKGFSTNKYTDEYTPGSTRNIFE